MDDKVMLTKCQNHQYHRGVLGTWTKWARPQAEWVQGPIDRPNSMAGQPGLRRFSLSLGCHASAEGGERQDGGESRWRPPSCVAWPPGLHLTPNRLLLVGGGPIHPYKYPPQGESRDTTLYL
jgi:hypothetical protein